MTDNYQDSDTGFILTDYHLFSASFVLGNTQFDAFCDCTFVDNSKNGMGGGALLRQIQDKEINMKKGFHNHPHCEIILVLKGPILMQTEENKSQLGDNSICFFPQKYMHVLRLSSGCRYYSISFTFKKTAEKNRFLNTFDKFDEIFGKHAELHDQPKLINIALEMQSYISTATEFSYFITESLLRLLILQLYENMAGKSYKADRRENVPVIANMTHRINQRINNIDSNIKLKDIADELFISKRQLSRIIKKQYGVSFSERKMQLRIENAKLLLKNTELSIEKIAERCSFYDAGTFIKKFTVCTGTSPKQYRKKFLAGRDGKE